MLILTPAERELRSAFSLIEVVLSLGVIAFALVAILGVFPTGMAANRSSITDTRAAQILQAITATIDAQCDTFTLVDCYGETLDLGSLTTADAAKTLYASYGPTGPAISNSTSSDYIYKIDLRFDNDPTLTASGSRLGPGKLNRIQLRLSGRSGSEGFVEVFYLARKRS